MKQRTVLASSLGSMQRLDSHYFLSPGVQAVDRLNVARRAGIPFQTLAGANGLGKVWQPQRFKRAYAAVGEERIPYLRPYDVFDYVPRAADYLSRRRTKKLNSLFIGEGTILQTCSGRNLGPAVMVDRYLADFALSHDMVRIEIDDNELRWFVLAFLQGPTGQNLLRRDKSGSVIDHISAQHVAAVEVPLLEASVRGQVAHHMSTATRLRETARLKLGDLIKSLEETLPRPERGIPMAAGWSVSRTDLQNRLDAALYDPRVQAVREELLAGGGVYVRDIATVVKPGGRYKTNYVDEAHGRPILSGGQVLQFQPINLRHIAPRSFKSVADYEISAHWILYPADGRAEEALGTPTLVPSSRAGWLASGHVGRVIANNGVDPGWLYLALSTWQAQIQLKSMASGSVVDSTFEGDMENVVLPPPKQMAKHNVVELWEQFAKSEAEEHSAIACIETELDSMEKVVLTV